MARAAQREPGSRRDARRNHAALVTAAGAAFAQDGVDTRLDEIARRAGVGTATLYRHFPNRGALVEAIFAERVDEFFALAEGALEEPDAWAGLVGSWRRRSSFRAETAFCSEIFVRYPPGEGLLGETRQQLRELFEKVVGRAHAQGVLRPDFGVPDLALVLWSFAPVIDATAEVAPTAWRRHLHWLLDGLRPEGATPQSEPPLDEEQFAEAMRRRREQRFQQRPATGRPARGS